MLLDATGPQLLLITGPKATALGLREARRRAGQALQLRGLSQSGFDAALAALYQQGDQTDSAAGLSFDLEDLEVGPVQRDLLEDSAEAPVIQLVNTLLRRAVSAGASDLHVEPHEDGLRIRMRVDGFLQVAMDRSDVPVRRIVSRLKVMAGLDIAETRLPQDGRIPLRLGGRLIDTRVSSLPGKYGERIVLRILDRTTGLMSLENLGLSPSQAALLQRLAALPNGIILATGPTGSGKTTTLYSLLQLANSDARNIVTVEDPVEYQLERINQVGVNPKIGLTFGTVLRSCLRQDPDILLVGEIRDQETAAIALRAAMTGHMVLSTLHTNDAISSAMRLVDIGVEGYMAASALRGVLAQRLVRKICEHCSESYSPSEHEQRWVNARRQTAPGGSHFHCGRGCTYCNNTGYSGRIGIFELLELDEPMADALRANDTQAFSRAAQASEGFTTLTDSALEYAAQGITTLDEVFRVTEQMDVMAEIAEPEAQLGVGSSGAGSIGLSLEPRDSGA